MERINTQRKEEEGEEEKEAFGQRMIKKHIDRMQKEKKDKRGQPDQWDHSAQGEGSQEEQLRKNVKKRKTRRSSSGGASART